MITKYVVKIPYEEMIDWNESIEKYIEIVCEHEENAIQIFRNIIINNFTFKGKKIEGHFYIIKRSIDIDKFFTQDTKLYYAFIHNNRISDIGNKNKVVHLEETSSSYYEKIFYEYQKEINEILNINNGIPSIENTHDVINFCNKVSNMNMYFNNYRQMKKEEKDYEQLKWW